MTSVPRSSADANPSALNCQKHPLPNFWTKAKRRFRASDGDRLTLPFEAGSLPNCIAPALFRVNQLRGVRTHRDLQKTNPYQMLK
jgi:hypothetical protein